jgi:2,3-bisphosphoglycerate-independent phosphoglycerate mutase
MAQNKANYKPVVLMVLDGWGISDEKRGNAILNANLPTFLELDQFYPKTYLQASGISVGLPWLQYGNSEVGHQTLGTGQVTFQDLPRISNAIKNGEFFKNEMFLSAMKTARENGSKLHLLGLASDGGVHAHIDHLLALLEMAKDEGIGNQTMIHFITDGRDTSPTSAEKYIKKVLDAKTGKIATLAGRYYTMDRNNNWDRVKKGYDAMVLGEGIKETAPLQAIKNQYSRNLTDEHIEPVVITDNAGQAVGKIEANDVVIFYNYRKDRARQIANAFINPEFKDFPTQNPNGMRFICMIAYEEGLKSEIAFPPQEIKHRLSEIISNQGRTQLKIAETEKYAHVTYFFNGGVETPYEKEDQILVPSKNASYDEIPEMSAREVTQKLKEQIPKNIYDFILINYANPDMVGHTGTYEAAVKSVEVLNETVKEIIIAVLEMGGCLLITADHGNVEEMINLKTGERDTQHSTNPVPCWLVTPENRRTNPITSQQPINIQGMLVDVAPTVLSLLNLPKPPGMIGMDLKQIMK